VPGSEQVSSHAPVARFRASAVKLWVALEPRDVRVVEGARSARDSSNRPWWPRAPTASPQLLVLSLRSVNSSQAARISVADETADAVISRARARADALLAAARTKTDQASAGQQPNDALKTLRAIEDHILQRERVTADHVLRIERSEHVSLLSQERQATDDDLCYERTRSDKALATRDDFMGIVSHDLLNLLNAMVGVSSLIEKEVAEENHVERVVAHARRVQRSGARMRRLVGDLVDVASIEAGMLTVTCAVGHPADVVTEAVETFQAQASGSGISLRAEIVPGLPPVAFDAARILQVLCNLLSNGLKFTPAQGTVVVRLEQVDDNVVCCVSDTGEGIPEDKLETVFDRFVQLTKNDRRGVGLGLFISKCIVQGHGGRIWAENRTGQGSAFCFTLPVSANAVVTEGPRNADSGAGH
jgi:signal transduction histidine kinase